MSGKRLDPDYTEDTVAVAIEMYLALQGFPWSRFSIELLSKSKERFLGADARLANGIRGFRPFYMQFKRPFAYPSDSQSKIIKDRKAVSPKLTTDPKVLYFSLRDKQPNHREYQHNVLFRLRRRLKSTIGGEAAYVCPLFLDKLAYRHQLRVSALQRWARFWKIYPFEFKELFLQADKRLDFKDVPILAEHVVIPPHAMVSNAKHSYSFTESGRELCFHSPLALPEGTRSLSDWLQEQFQEGNAEDGLIRPDNSFAMLERAFFEGEGAFQVPPQVDASDSGIQAWMAWGDYLETSFSIQQYAFVERDGAWWF